MTGFDHLFSLAEDFHVSPRCAVSEFDFMFFNSIERALAFCERSAQRFFGVNAFDAMFGGEGDDLASSGCSRRDAQDVRFDLANEFFVIRKTIRCFVCFRGGFSSFFIRIANGD